LWDESQDDLILGSSSTLGIGTTAPDGRFHIWKGASGGTPHSAADEMVIESDATMGITLISPDSTAQYIMFADATLNDVGNIAYDHTSDKMYFQANNARRMTIDGANGRVGIGTTAPVENLDVRGELSSGTPQTGGSLALFKQVTRASGNSTETFTVADMGFGDNCTALINIAIGSAGAVSYDYGGALIYWQMPRGAGSAIQSEIVAPFKGSGVSAFSLAVSGNSLVVTKDTDLNVAITVIGGGGTSDIGF